jgi:hypothetical protein
MPFEITPSSSGFVQPRHSRAFTDPNWSWLVNQEYNPERVWQQNQTTRRGTLTGGPSYQRTLEFGNEQQFVIARPRPVLTTPILPDEQEFYRRQLGAIEWDSIDPFSTVDQVASQVQQATGSDPLAFTKGAQDFFASKGVDLMGMGSTGAPVRAADYALAFPIAVFQKLTGQRSVQQAPLPQDNVYYKFQADPRYWQTIAASTPEQLDALARVTAAKYVDASANGYLVQQLRQQFDTDRAKQVALTSGNPAVDYQAIKRAATGIPGTGVVIMPGIGSGFTKIPVLGTQMAELLDPITDADRKTWADTPQEQRLALLTQYGMTQMVADFVGAVPALNGLGTIIAVARGGGVAARTLAATYDWTLRAGGYMMTAGLAAATTNWALEAANPDLPLIGQYREFGALVDSARPISSSQFAGIVNTIGYWSSGTYGASNILRAGARAVGVAREANAAARAVMAVDHGMPVPSAGMPETPLYNVGFGGSRMDGILTRAGLLPGLLTRSKQRVHMSEAVHVGNRPLLDSWEAAIDGAPTGRAEIDILPPEEKILAAQRDLQANVTTMHSTGELYVQVLNLARRPAKLFRSDEALGLYRWARDTARSIDDAMAQRYMGSYGSSWIVRTAGAYTEDAMRSYVVKAIDRLGGDSTALSGIRGESQWAQAMRSVHQYEFDFRNSQLHEALSAPGLGTDQANEFGKLSLVSSYHLFHDEANAAVKVLRGDDVDAAKAMIAELIGTTKEAEVWFSNHWRPPAGSAREVNLVKPSEMADWLEDISSSLMVRRRRPSLNNTSADLPLNALHTQLVKDGVWDLAFKPVNANGEFVSYVHTREGHAFQTPWLEYPLGNADNIQMGNRGIGMRKFDAVARGFRTWRIAEFQRASLARNLTSRFPDMKAAQLDAFHEGLLTLARRYNVQPQTLGTVAQGLPGIGRGYADDIEKLAAKTFGAGPYLTRNGTRVAVDWRKEIAKAYRQSLKLNATAGATSQLKSRFGSLGANAAWASDIGYVIVRFGLSPLFKVGEVIESKAFNAMAGIPPGADPWVDAVMYRTGFGSDVGPLATEMTYDQTMQGLNILDPRYDTAQARQARNYIFQARTAPETMAQKQAKAAIQERVNEFHAYVQGGNSIYASPRHALEVELAELTDEFGNILPGADDRADEISRILTGELRPEEVAAQHHVGAEFPDETWSTDPADLGPQDWSAAYGGMPKWIDPDTLPADRGLWHATTNVDGVMGSGLKSRLELVQESWAKEPDLVRALTAGISEGNGQWRDMRVTYLGRGGGGIEYKFQPAGGDLHNLHRAGVGKPFRNGELYDHMNNQSVLPAQITKVEVENRVANKYETTWQRSGEAPANMGLGKLTPDSSVSLTTEYAHADTIRERMVLAISAARNEATPKEIIDHFESLYDATGTGDIAFSRIQRIASDVAHSHRTPLVDDGGRAIADRIDVAADWSELEDLLGAYFNTGELKYNLVKKLDDKLGFPNSGVEGFDPASTIGFVGDWRSLSTADPSKVGIVRVGIKKGANWRTGPDAFEVQVDSHNLWTLDHRILDHPLATDRDGLLDQLRQTIREDGETVVPGFEALHAEIQRALVDLDAAAKPPGELRPADFMAHQPKTPVASLERVQDLAGRIRRERGATEGVWTKLADDSPWTGVQVNQMSDGRYLAVVSPPGWREIQATGATEHEALGGLAEVLERLQTRVEQNAAPEDLVFKPGTGGDPRAEMVPTKLLHGYREFNRRIEPKFPGTPAPRYRDTDLQLYRMAIKDLEEGHGLPFAHPVTAEPWRFKDLVEAGVDPAAVEADALRQLRAEMAALEANKGGSYYQLYKRHIEAELAAGRDPFSEPLILEYDPATQTALLVEGNHRLGIAEDLGIDHLPVRVVVKQSRVKKPAAAAPEPLDISAHLSPAGTRFYAVPNGDGTFSRGWHQPAGPGQSLGTLHVERDAAGEAVIYHTESAAASGTAATMKAVDEQLAADAAAAPAQVWSVRDGRFSFRLKREAAEAAERAKAATQPERLGPLHDARPIKGPDGKWYVEELRNDPNAPAAAAPTPPGPDLSTPPGPKWKPLPDEPMLKPNVDGYIPADAKPSQIFSQRVDTVEKVEDIFGTPEKLTAVMEEQAPEFLQPSPYDDEHWWQRAWSELKNPVPGKEAGARRYRVEKMRRDFPFLLQAAGLDDLAHLLGRELGLPERDWLPFLMEDRLRATDFANSGSPEAFQHLVDLAGPDARGEFDALYASEEWGAFTGLLAIAEKSAADDAFRVHFFNPNRSAIERSLNHPLMGVYPLSWAYKAAREWMRFLYENRTIPELRLGMSPAVAMNSLVRAQNIAFAQTNPEQLEEFISTRGPFGSTLLMFNLLLPGDWSNIPFPASRTIRDALRGKLGARTLGDNVAGLGAVRDFRMMIESAGEIGDFLDGPDQPKAGKNGQVPVWRPHPNTPPRQPSTLFPGLSPLDNSR